MNTLRRGLAAFLAALVPYLVAAEEEYRGRFTPDADYVLSGQLREDVGPLPPMPYRYLGKNDGYDPSALTPVPEPGVHPRVLMSPEDVKRIQEQVARGDAADRTFRIVWNDVRSKAAQGDMLCMALQALATNDDVLGRKAAEMLVEEAEFREPMIDIFNTHTEMEHIRDNWYYYARTSISKVGGVYYDEAFQQGGADLIATLAQQGVSWFNDGDRQQGVFFNTPLSNYDYLYRWLTEDERVRVRRVLSKLTFGRYTTGMELPGHMFINNHMSMGEDLLLLNLAIEGEEGWDPRLIKEYAPAVRNKITYDVSRGGQLHEKCKGFLPERAAIAIARRAHQNGLPLLAHDHLKQMVWGKVMDSANLHARYGAGRHTDVAPLGQSATEPRLWTMGLGSGPWMDQFFNWAFVLKHVYPADPVVDYYYKSRMHDNGFGAAGTDPSEPLPSPRIDYTHRDVMLMTATDGLRHADGSVIDYDASGLPREVTANTRAWVDLARGVAMSRASWDPDALMIHYECRSDVLSAGHETPEAGDFNLYADGVEWSGRRDWYMDCYFRNMVLIDGYAGVYSPVAGKLMEVEDNATATTFISDATDQYNWRKLEKIFQLWHPMFGQDLGHMDPYREHAMNLDRDVELPFQAPIREYQEGYVGLDWGNWHGETRGPERFQRWNDVDHVFRTLHMTKGDSPYALVIDDVRKDHAMHQYDWCFKLSPDVTLYKADSTVRNRYLEKGMPEDRTTDLILCLTDTREARFEQYGMKNERQPKTGDPMLLVRVLWRNSTSAYPQPALEASWGPKRIIIPAMAVDPEFRVLLFPHRFGDSLPLTSWNSDRTRLTIQVGGRTDVYTFAKTDRERTVFTMARDGQVVAAARSGPSIPALETPRGYTPDRNQVDPVRRHVISGPDALRLKEVPPGMRVRYTVDGSTPTPESTLYRTGIEVDGSCTLRARTFARYWPFGEKGSATMTLQVDHQVPVVARTFGSLARGVKAEVFEIRHTLFEGKNGIFTGHKNMLPDLSAHVPMRVCRVPGITIPRAGPVSPVVEMKKAYYRFTGVYRAATEGVHGFRLNSCGPIQLKVAGRPVIDISGPYGHSQKDRFGEIALREGDHALEAIVCDPVFWKGDREEPYVVSLAVLGPGTDVYVSCEDALYHEREEGVDAQPVIPLPHSSGAVVEDGVPGLVLNRYDRTALGRVIPPTGLPLSHLAIADGEVPYRVQPVLGIEPSDSAACLLEYTGFFIADRAGDYAFQMDRSGGNQLFVGGHEILRNNLIGPRLPGLIHLEEGAHPFVLRLAQSSPACRVRLPGRESFVAVGTGMFMRPSNVSALDDGRRVVTVDGESLEPPAMEVRGGSLVEGKVGKAIQFRGPKTGLLLRDIPSPENALTIAFWIRIDHPSDASILDSDWGSHPSARLRGYAMQTMYFRGSEETRVDLRTVGADRGEWVHLALVYDDRAALYVNGQLRDWKPKTAKSRTAYIQDISLFRNQQATIDELHIYNSALSEQEVRRISGF